MAGGDDEDARGRDRDRMSAEEAKAKFEELVAAAEKRGGTQRGEVLVNVVEGRRLS